jgi:DNA-binding transcriptional regulator YdaS (Cro superfamily)
MQKNEAVMWFGSQNKLAKFLGVYQSNVSGWKRIPLHHQQRIEEHTKGELLADKDRSDYEVKGRFMCNMEAAYLKMIDKQSEKQGVPKVEILRRAIKFYHEAHS